MCLAVQIAAICSHHYYHVEGVGEGPRVLQTNWKLHIPSGHGAAATAAATAGQIVVAKLHRWRDR